MPRMMCWAMCLSLLAALPQVCQAEAPDATSTKVQQILLLGQSPDGHPPGTHEYLPAMRILEQLLSKIPGVEVELVNADSPWPQGPELLAKADGVVLFASEGARWLREDPRRREAFARLAQRGGGFSVIHWGMGTKDAENIADFVRIFGACHGGPDRRFKVVDVHCDFAKHAVTKGLEPLDVHEEFYFKLKMPQSKKGLVPLLQVNIEGQDETVCWAWDRPEGGRSFGFSGLHFHENWSLSQYRRLIAQGVLWTVGREDSFAKINLDVDKQLLELPEPAQK